MIVFPFFLRVGHINCQCRYIEDKLFIAYNECLRALGLNSFREPRKRCWFRLFTYVIIYMAGFKSAILLFLSPSFLFISNIFFSCLLLGKLCIFQMLFCLHSWLYLFLLVFSSYCRIYGRHYQLITLHFKTTVSEMASKYLKILYFKLPLPSSVVLWSYILLLHVYKLCSTFFLLYIVYFPLKE